MSGTCPFREEAAFFVRVDESLLYLFVYRRIHQVQEWEQATECIPKSGIGVHISGKHLTVVGTIMNRLTVRCQFIEFTGKQERTVKTGVECTVLIQIAAFYFYFAQYMIPGIIPFLYQLFKGVVA